jgi:hypothetical protein
MAGQPGPDLGVLVLSGHFVDRMVGAPPFITCVRTMAVRSIAELEAYTRRVGSRRCAGGASLRQGGRIIDVSAKAAQALGLKRDGVMTVTVEVLAEDQIADRTAVR